MKRYEPGDLIMIDDTTSALVINVLPKGYILLIIDMYEATRYSASIPVSSKHKYSTIFRGITND